MCAKGDVANVQSRCWRTATQFDGLTSRAIGEVTTCCVGRQRHSTLNGTQTSPEAFGAESYAQVVNRSPRGYRFFHVTGPFIRKRLMNHINRLDCR
jgi:hypothetical protein